MHIQARDGTLRESTRMVRIRAHRTECTGLGKFQCKVDHSICYKIEHEGPLDIGLILLVIHPHPSSPLPPSLVNMPKAKEYSLDIKQRIIKLHKEGNLCGFLSALLSIPRTIIRHIVKSSKLPIQYRIFHGLVAPPAFHLTWREVL